MHQIVPDLFVLRGFPPYAINVYLMGDVLLDAGTRYAGPRILRQLRGRRVRTHALTHVHADHQGASHHLCRSLGLPLWCSATEASAMEQGDLSQQHPRNLITAFQERWWAGPDYPVARALRKAMWSAALPSSTHPATRRAISPTGVKRTARSSWGMCL